MLYKLVFRVFILLIFFVQTPAKDENVARLLVPGKASICDAHRSCVGVVFEDRSCLNVSIPWEVPYLQVRCAFRCCLGYWQQKLGLIEVLKLRRKQLKSKKYLAYDPYEVLVHRYSIELISTMRIADERENKNVNFPKHGIAYELPFNRFVKAQGGYSVGSPLQPAVYVHPGDDPFAFDGDNECSRGEFDCYLPSPNSTSQSMHAIPMGFFAPAWKHYDHVFKYHKESNRSESARPVLLGCGCCLAIGRTLVKTKDWQPPEDERQSKLTHRAYVHKILRQNGFPCDCTDVWRKNKEVKWIPKLSKPSGRAVNYWCPPRDYGDLMTSRKFTVSPYGHGWANFREWEILGFGGVPLVDWHQGTEEIFRHLPVVQVKNWSEITPDFLNKEWVRLTNSKIDMKLAYWPWWFMMLTKHMVTIVENISWTFPTRSHMRKNMLQGLLSGDDGRDVLELLAPRNETLVSPMSPT